MHLIYIYIYIKCITKALYLEKARTSYNLEWRKYSKIQIQNVQTLNDVISLFFRVKKKI